MKHSISASLGAFKNHLRWLVLLSDYYNGILNEEGFLIDGKSFPMDARGKLDFIKENVYPNNRDCLNWLDFEWLMREKLDNILYVEHSPQLTSEKNKDASEHRMVVMWAEPKECILGYAKFEPGMHGRTFEEFSVKITQEKIFAKKYETKKKPNEKVLSVHAYRLYNPVLDKEFYDQVVEFFEIDNQYNIAQQVHEIWYNLQRNARRQAYTLMQNAEWPDFPWYSKLVYFKPKTEQEFNRMKDLVIRTYEEDMKDA